MEAQYGFTAQGRTVEQIFNVRTLMQSAREVLAHGIH